MEWLQTILRHVRQGRHAFIITGDIGDGFPREGGSEPDALVPWYDIVSSVLRSGNPDHLCWTFDPARGFLFKDPEDEKAFVSFLNGGEDEDKKKKKDDEDDDPISALRREVDGIEEGRPMPFVQAMPATLSVFTAAACVEEAKRRPCVALVHDADAVWNGQASDERVTRAFLAMYRIAESDGYRRAGHILMVATPSVSALPERFRRPDSPFTTIRIMRPSHDERSRFLGNIVVTEDLRERLGELHQAKLRRNSEAMERLLASIAAAEADLVVQADTSIDDDELRQAENAAKVARQKLEQSTAAWTADHEGRLARLRSIEAGLVECVPERALSARAMAEACVGDIIEFRKDGDPANAQGKTVLWANKGDLHLSLATDPKQLHMHPEDDDRPIVFYWGSEGFSQRRSSLKTGKKFSLTDKMKAVLVPKERHDLLAQKAQMERAIKGAGESRPQQTELTERAETTRQMADDLRNGRIKERQKRIDAARAHLDHLRAMKAMGQTGAEPDEEADRQEQELLAGRYPPPACGIQEMARLSQGLGYRDIVQMFRSAQRDGKECDAKTVLAERHRSLDRSYGHLVEIVTPAYGFDGIAGLAGIKRFFGNVRDDIAKGMHGRVPMGCMLMGPPGTGKTAIAEAFAQECGFLFVKIRNVRSMWNGETERMMEDLTAGLHELAPVVVLRDEVDQEDTGRDAFQGDSGVSARIRRKWMEFLSDPSIRGRVFVISCSNRPDLLDAALKRSGRTDERIPVLMPDAETRMQLFPVMLKRAQATLPGITIESHVTEEDLKRLAEMTDDLSGADIEVIVRHAVEYAKVKDTTIVVDAKCLKRAVEDFMPSDSSMQIAKMTLSALSSCARKEFLPKNVREISLQCLAKLGVDPEVLKKLGKNEDSLTDILAKHKPGTILS